MKSCSMLIRPADEQDIPAIIKLLSELGYNLDDSPAFRRTWKEIFSDPKMGIVVADDEGTIAGYLAYSFRPQLRLLGLSMEIDELSVLSSYRGRGIGADLIEFAKDLAKSKSIKRIILSTNRERDSYKRNFYQKNGFQEKNSAWMKMDLKH